MKVPVVNAAASNGAEWCPIASDDETARSVAHSAFTVGSLFSGIGGIDLGFAWAGFETRWFCEIDPYCQRVLAKHWPGVHCYEDIRTITDAPAVDVIAGGFPCQPFSRTGKRRGIDDDRDFWPAMRRVYALHRPRWVVCENVAHFARLGLERTLFDLEDDGYRGWAVVFPAGALGAVHLRERVWVIASRGDVADAASERWGSGLRGTEAGESVEPARRSWWATEPGVCRVDDGLPGRLDRVRLRALGNAVVPQCAEVIARAILAAEGVLP